LMQMASERLQVPASQLQVQAGIIRDSGKPSNAVTYGQLVEGKRIERHLADVPVKAAGFKVIGTSLRRKDGPDKVTARRNMRATCCCRGCCTRPFCGRRRTGRR